MKKRVLLGMAGILLAMSALFAQDIPSGAVEALKKGSSQELNKYLGEKVDLVIRNRAVNADKAKATTLLNAFFSENKVRGFDTNHQGKRDGSGFLVGTLDTANGYFRVNCFFKCIHEKYFIHQIRIDKTNE